MVKEEKLSKRSVKTLVSILRVIPMILALCEFINSVLYLFGLECPALSFIGGTSFIPLLFIYLASWVFGFCTYHRMFLYYVFVLHVINVIDFTFTIPVSNLTMLSLHAVITGVFLYLVLYFRKKECRCLMYLNPCYSI